MAIQRLADEIYLNNLKKTCHNKQMVVVYQSHYGHTQKVATAIVAGAKQVRHIAVTSVNVQNLTDDDWQLMDNADMLVFGSAVYLGSVTAQFKIFMDSTSKRWYNRQWHGKWAAGFANSGGLSGDKLSVLQQLNLFAMQHGMFWVGLPLLPTGHQPSDLNRLSSFLGLMTQSDNAATEVTPPEGDLNTAKWFGKYLANVLLNH